MAIIKRPFRILTDFPAVRQFMVENYQLDWGNGVAAPFLEYALSSSWSDITLTHRNAIWEEDGRIVAFCFSETQHGAAFLSYRPAYAFLCDEMIAHAMARLTDDAGRVQLSLFRSQTPALEAAARAGYRETATWTEWLCDLSAPPDFPLAAGYRFVEPGQADPRKCLICCHKGFNHEPEEGPWHGSVEDAYRMQTAPNATQQYNVVVEHIASGEYVCYAGMWWLPENDLAYMEPLCTVPEHRRKGLAAAALSEMARRMIPLGAKYMTGGDNPFYPTIGYTLPVLTWVQLKRPEDAPEA